MGLDSVELLIRMEKYFDIAIPDQEAARIVTVQDFVDCVVTKVLLNPTEKCRSQMLFYRFRNYFIDKHKRTKDEIVPDTRIQDLIETDLQETWADMAGYLGIDLPPLSEWDLDSDLKEHKKILGITLWKRNAPVTTGTVNELVKLVSLTKP